MPPDRRLLPDLVGERLRRGGWFGGEADLPHPLAEPRVVARLQGGAVQLPDQLGGRAGGRHQRLPGADVERAQSEIREIRHAGDGGKQRARSGASHGEGRDLALADERHQGRRELEHHVDGSGLQVRHRRSGAAIGDVQCLNARRLLHGRHGEVRGAAHPGGAEAQSLRILARPGDQLAEVGPAMPCGRLLVDGADDGPGAELADGGEVAVGIEGQAAVEGLVGAERGHADDAQGGSVRTGLGDKVGTDDARAA